MEIIKEFRRGNLPDCEEGTTLRPYLAKKLHCNPMRLSKKLSKAMSNSDTNATNPGSNGPGYFHRPQIPCPSQRFTDLERAFHKATLDRKAVLASSSVCSSKASTPPPAPAAKTAGEGQGASASSLMMPMTVPLPPPRPGTATNANMLFAMPMYQSGQQEQPQPMMPTNSIESALLQNQASMQAQMASQMRQIQQLQESLSKAKAELEKKEQTVKHQAELHQSFLRALSSRASSSSSPDSQQPFGNPNGESRENEKGRSDSTTDYTEILAGFEKAAAPSDSGGATDLDATQIPLWSTVDTALPLGSPETPTMTSKSFDDFHRFLGQGIPSMPNLARGEQNNASTSGNNGQGGVKPRPIAVATVNGPATEALHGQREGSTAGDISFNINASEDYSLLAQQSVLAAMQHSAYAAQLKTKQAGNASKKRNSRTISEANSSGSSDSEPGAKRTRTAVSPQRSTVSTTSSSNSAAMRATIVTESESMFDSSSRGVTSSSGSGSSGSGSDNDNSNDGTTSNDGSDDAVDSFGDNNATAKVAAAAATAKATKEKATMDVSGSPQ